MKKTTNFNLLKKVSSVKKWVFLAMIAFTTIIGQSTYAQVQVGEEQATTPALPINPYFKKSMSQNIYLASDINAAGQITTLSWQYNGTGDIPNSKQVKVYLKTTSKVSFDTTTDWIPFTQEDIVFTGTIETEGTPGWKTITLDTPFSYNGTENLVVGVIDDFYGTTDDGNSKKFLSSNQGTNRSIYYQTDSSNTYDLLTPTSSSGRSNFVANIIFGGISQTCPKPINPTALVLSQNSAQLSWEASNSTFDIQYGEPGFTLGQGQIVSNVTNNYTLTGLNPATTYQYYVRSICGEETSAWILGATFTTQCGEINAPYTQNFDSTPSGYSNNITLPTCWSYIHTGLGYGYTSSSTTNSVSPSNAYYMYNGLDTTADSHTMLISPNMRGLSNGNMRVKFAAKGSNAGFLLEFGTMSNPNDPTTFEVIDPISLTNSFVIYTINIPQGENTYFAFRHGMGGTYRSIYIDDVIFEQQPTCADVNEISISNISYNQATISWDTLGDQFEVEFGVTGFTRGTGEIRTTTTNQLVLDGLSGSTTYQFYVRKICGEDEGQWSSVKSFTTQIAPVSAPWEEVFVNATAPLGWTTTGWNVGTSTRILNASANTIYKNLDNTNRQGTFRTIVITNITEAMVLRFNYQVSDYTLTSSLPEAGSCYFDVYIIKNGIKETTPIYTYDTNTTVTGWINVEASLAQYAGDVIAIQVEATRNADDFMLAFDNFFIGVPATCDRPEALTATNISGRTATLSWNAVEGAANYAWIVVTDGENPETSMPIASGTTAETSVIVTQLNPTTPYDAYVRTDCGEDNFSNWSLKKDFTTTIACPIPSVGTATNITTTSALLSWSSDAEIFDINWGIGIFNAGEGANLETAVANNFSLENLTEGTTYRFFVRTNCTASEDGTSTWAGPYTFTTLVSGQIGSGTTMGQHFPINSNYKYNYTQQIYTVSQVAAAIGTENNYITKIKFFYNGTSSTTPNTTVVNATNFKTWKVYLANTDKTSFISYTSWIAEQDMQVVFEGDITLPENGNWMEIEFTTPFLWDTTQNLAVAVSERVPEYGSTTYWKTFLSGDNAGIYFRTDTLPTATNDPSNPANPGTATSRSATINQIALTAIPVPTCLPASMLSVSNVFYNTATLNWNSDATSFDIEYGPTGFTQGEGTTLSGVTAPYQLTGLTAETSYDFYIRANCEAEGFSPWTGPKTFTTTIACPVPTALGHTQQSLTSTLLTWESATNEVELVWGENGFDPLQATPIAVTGASYLINELTTDAQYQFYVRLNCTSFENGVSDWAGPFNFSVGYCIPTYTNGGSGDNIVSVVLNDLIDAQLPTEAPYYYNRIDTQNTVPSLEKGSTHTIYLKMGTNGTQYSRIWVDFNNDGVFSPEESFSTGTSVAGGATAEITFTVPTDAVLGEVRLRIRGGEDSQILPVHACGASSNGYGRAIDYIVNIIEDTADAIEFENVSFKAFPNPVKDYLHITAGSPIKTITVYNLLGQVVITQNVMSNQSEVDFSQLPSGNYIVKATTQIGTQTIKINKK